MVRARSMVVIGVMFLINFVSLVHYFHVPI